MFAWAVILAATHLDSFILGMVCGGMIAVCAFRRRMEQENTKMTKKPPAALELREMKAPTPTLEVAPAMPVPSHKIEIVNPLTHGVGQTRYTDYEIRARVRYVLNGFSFVFKKLVLCVDCFISFSLFISWRMPSYVN